MYDFIILLLGDILVWGVIQSAKAECPPAVQNHIIENMLKVLSSEN
jgi:hypothetical protein